MEARKLKTLDDLLMCQDERAELIGGEILYRPMARFQHGMVQGNTRAELNTLTRQAGPGGWWIATEVSVAYEAHECPTHDLAGWRKERLPGMPSGVMDLAPDWVCEIVSPGHERKDTLQLLLLLQRHQVPHYWLIWPEDRTLIAYALEEGQYKVIATLEKETRARIPPFEAIELDLAYMLAMEE